MQRPGVAQNDLGAVRGLKGKTRDRQRLPYGSYDSRYRRAGPWRIDKNAGSNARVRAPATLSEPRDWRERHCAARATLSPKRWEGGEV